MRFRNRHEAGRRLADRLVALRPVDPVVFALPRGGVPVGYEVAHALGAPLEVVVARKLGAPGQPELGVGAIAEGGVTVLDEHAVRSLRLTKRDIARLVARERAELERRLRDYRGDRRPPPLAGRTAIVVDDGLATGVSARAALASLRARGPARLIFAAPTCAPDAPLRLGGEADEIVCVATPADFVAVGRWYEDFTQVPDAVVVDLLARAAGEHAAAAGTAQEPPGARPEGVTVAADEHLSAAGSAQEPPGARPEGVTVAVEGAVLDGDLVVPEGATAVVVFAHGSGSGRHSPRNRLVADRLQAAGFATLLLDLLTPEEERGADLRFDIGLLADRLVAAGDHPALAGLALGAFGASTGAAAALVAAARRPDRFAAVVSRGGRPDLAGDDLARVRAPTLLLVGDRDPQVLDLNRAAMNRLTAPARLEVIPGATHLFPEPGRLEAVADAAADWFGAHLGDAAPSA